MEKVKVIGMVVAMEKEVKPLLEGVGVETMKTRHGDFEVFGYTFEGKEVYLVQSGIGEISASAATQLLISKYGAQIILNFGVCGGLVKSKKVFDTVIVNGVVHYDFDLSSIDDVKVGQYPGKSSPVISCDSALIEVAKKAMPNSGLEICASADKFVADEGVKRALNEQFGATVCDMECAGVLITAGLNGVPTLIVKAVSDSEGGAEEFSACVHRAATAYVGAFIQILKEF